MIIKPLTKTGKRMLIERLEYYYQLELTEYRRYHDYAARHNKKTTHENVDRNYRMRLKSIEIVLHSLGSTLFEKNAKPSFRRSNELIYVNPFNTDKKRVSSNRGSIANRKSVTLQITSKTR